VRNVNTKIVFCLAMFTCVFLVACHNSIMERWWADDRVACGGTEPAIPSESGGSGANFGVARFNTDGGLPNPKDINIAWGNVVGRLRPMERGSDGFVGWFDENDNPWDVETRPVRPEDDVDGDGFITLTAVWSHISHTVSFVTTPSTSVIPDQSVASGSNVIQPVKPAEPGDGRGFAGWFTEDGTGGNWGRQWSFVNDVVIGNITLHARWAYETRTVILLVNGGTRPNGAELTRTHFTIPVSYGVIQDPGPLVKDGHSLGGWFTDAAYINKWDFMMDRVTEPDETPGVNPFFLLAKWVPNIYLVSFEVNSPTASQPSVQEVAHGNRVIRPNVVNPGATLLGWFTDANHTTEWDFNRNFVTSTMVLYARWESPTPPIEPPDPVEPGDSGGGGVNFGVVRFNTDGGTPNPLNLEIAWGNVVGRLRPMERDGDGFVGWFDENGDPWNVETRPVEPEDDVNDDGFITLTARWSLASYTVSFEATPSSAVIPAQSVVSGGTVVQPVNPASGDGHGFGGWFTGSGTNDNWGRQWDFANDAVHSSMTLFARWSDYQTRTVAFQVDGGTRPNGTDMMPIHFTIPIAYGKIQDPGPLVREGHSFGGWFTDPFFASNTQWDFATDRVQYPDLRPGEDPFYLYAKWIPNIYFVSFEVNSEEVSPPERKEVAHGTGLTRPVLAIPGMVLTGWFTDAERTVEWDFDSDVVTSTMVLYANWEAATYTVTFNLRMPDGAAPHPQPPEQNVTHNGRIYEPFMPPLAANVESDWFFYRWDYSSEGTDEADTFLPWNFDTGVTENMVLHARWVPYVPDMVWVPRGSFTMGDPSVSGSPAAYHAYPTRRVTLDGFYIGRYLVTQEEFESVMSENPDGITARPSQFAGQPTRPVERVSWFDAIVFANRLSADTPGLEPVFTVSDAETGLAAGSSTVYNIIRATVGADWSRNGFRLPTEAEWEFAARGGHDSPGNFSHAGSNNAADVAWFNTNSNSQTHTVGSKAPNALGIFDMNGNVSEWCWDWFDSYKNIITAHPGVEANNNPKGPTTGTERVRRGGSWNNAVGNVRNVVRSSATPNSANWVIGFRLARSAGAAEIW